MNNQNNTPAPIKRQEETADTQNHQDGKTAETISPKLKSLRLAIAQHLVEIEDTLYKFGLSSMAEHTSFTAHDPKLSQMYVHLTNTDNILPLIFRPIGSPYHEPPTDRWLLCRVHPLPEGDYQPPDYFALAAHDRTLDGSPWRTQLGPLGHRAMVKEWAELPDLRETFQDAVRNDPTMSDEAKANRLWLAEQEATQ